MCTLHRNDINNQHYSFYTVSQKGARFKFIGQLTDLQFFQWLKEYEICHRTHYPSHIATTPKYSATEHREIRVRIIMENNAGVYTGSTKFQVVRPGVNCSDGKFNRIRQVAPTTQEPATITLGPFNVTYMLSPVRLSSVFFNSRAPYSASWNFGNIYTAFVTLDIYWHPRKISRRSS